MTTELTETHREVGSVLRLSSATAGSGMPCVMDKHSDNPLGALAEAFRILALNEVQHRLGSVFGQVKIEGRDHDNFVCTNTDLALENTSSRVTVYMSCSGERRIAVFDVDLSDSARRVFLAEQVLQAADAMLSGDCGAWCRSQVVQSDSRTAC